MLRNVNIWTGGDWSLALLVVIVKYIDPGIQKNGYSFTWSNSTLHPSPTPPPSLPPPHPSPTPTSSESPVLFPLVYYVYWKFEKTYRLYAKFMDSKKSMVLSIEAGKHLFILLGSKIHNLMNEKYHTIVHKY